MLKWWKIVILLLFQFVIVVVAGLIIHALEGQQGFDRAAVITKEFESFRASHPCLNQKDLVMLYKTMDKAYKLKFKYDKGNFVGTSWDYLSSTYASMQMISSIGFGASPPKSTGGRVFLLFYELIGLPIFVSVAFGVSLQLLSVSDLVRRVFWKNARYKDYAGVHVTRTFILLLLGFIFFCLIPTGFFKLFDPNLDYWASVSIIAVYFIGPGQFVPAQLPDPSRNQQYRLFVGWWTLLYMLWFSGVKSTTYRIIVQSYDANDVPNPMNLENKNKAIVSRVWVKEGVEGIARAVNIDKPGGGIRRRDGPNKIDGKKGDNSGFVDSKNNFVSNVNVRRDDNLGKMVTGNVNVVKIVK